MEYFITYTTNKIFQNVCDKEENNQDCFKNNVCSWATSKGWEENICHDRRLKEESLILKDGSFLDTRQEADICPNRRTCHGNPSDSCINGPCLTKGEEMRGRFLIGNWNTEELKWFENKSGIENHPEFSLAPKSNLIKTTDTRIEHDDLLENHNDVGRYFGIEESTKNLIADYIKLAKKIARGQKHGDSGEGSQQTTLPDKIVPIDSGDTPVNAELPEIDDDVSTFLKNKFLKDVQDFPPLPTNGSSNMDWVTLSGFSKSNKVPEKTARAIFSPRRKFIRVEHNGYKYGKSESKGWEGLVWCQIPKEMKSQQNDCGYFFLRESLPDKYKKAGKQ